MLTAGLTSGAPGPGGPLRDRGPGDHRCPPSGGAHITGEPRLLSGLPWSSGRTIARKPASVPRRPRAPAEDLEWNQPHKCQTTTSRDRPSRAPPWITCWCFPPHPMIAYHLGPRGGQRGAALHRPAPFGAPRRGSRRKWNGSRPKQARS